MNKWTTSCVLSVAVAMPVSTSRTNVHCLLLCGYETENVILSKNKDHSSLRRSGKKTEKPGGVVRGSGGRPRAEPLVGRLGARPPTRVWGGTVQILVIKKLHCLKFR